MNKLTEQIHFIEYSYVDMFDYIIYDYFVYLLYYISRMFVIIADQQSHLYSTIINIVLIYASSYVNCIFHHHR